MKEQAGTVRELLGQNLVVLQTMAGSIIFLEKIILPASNEV